VTGDDARPGVLLLEDGRRFEGVLVGTASPASAAGESLPGRGEVVFQTGMTGYQEVITDPSYRGQIVAFTAAHIGNTGANRFDDEAPTPALAGIVVRSLSTLPSSWRSEESLPAFLARHRVPCLAEVDTRSLTRHLRAAGALRGAILDSDADPAQALAEVRSLPTLGGRDLVREVAPAVDASSFAPGPAGGAGQAGSPGAGREAATVLADEFPYGGRDREGRPLLDGRKLTLIHCGMKEGIDLALRRRGARVRIVGPAAGSEELLRGDPDGLLLSNGPGDPDALEGLIGSVRGVLGKVPVFGICLGHQVLALALGARTYKMKFGHHGINHPVRDVQSGRVLVTSHNHGFAVDAESLRIRGGGDVVGSAEITHVSLNDGVVEGFAVGDLRLRAVQFHPEAAGGPHDARSLFDDWARRV
jgi:carbamoyl-phosphate synthase small subunit